MAEKPEEGEKTEGTAKPAKKGGKMLMLLLPLVGAIAGVGATLAVPKPAGPAHHAEPPEEFGGLAVPDLKANLARSGGLHFCMVDIHVTFKTRKMKDVLARLGVKPGEGAAAAMVPMLTGPVGTAARDRLILLLASKSMEDLEGRDKKELLKKEIQSELQPILFPDEDGRIDAVLFKDLLIQ